MANTNAIAGVSAAKLRTTARQRGDTRRRWQSAGKVKPVTNCAEAPSGESTPMRHKCMRDLFCFVFLLFFFVLLFGSPTSSLIDGWTSAASESIDVFLAPPKKKKKKEGRKKKKELATTSNVCHPQTCSKKKTKTLISCWCCTITTARDALPLRVPLGTVKN